MRAVDELLGAHSISNDTWEALGAHFDDDQCMDLVFTIGGYQLLALAVNTLGIQPERD